MRPQNSRRETATCLHPSDYKFPNKRNIFIQVAFITAEVNKDATTEVALKGWDRKEQKCPNIYRLEIEICVAMRSTKKVEQRLKASKSNTLKNVWFR